MWNADIYNKYGKERMQPSIDLANRITKKDCKSIIDIGCGSGLSTLSLIHLFPNSKISGVDYSAEMLEKAKGLDTSVTWLQRDCSQSIKDLGTFDLVFSNAFIQWLSDQEAFIKNTKELLTPDGIFALQIPLFDQMEISHMIKDVASQYDSNHTLFNNIEKPTCKNYSLTEYYDMFTRYYGDISIWQTNYQHQMKDQNAILEFIRGTALLPYLERLSSSQTREFQNLLLDRLKNLYKVQENGKVLFEFKRLFIIVKK